MSREECCTGGESKEVVQADDLEGSDMDFSKVNPKRLCVTMHMKSVESAQELEKSLKSDEAHCKYLLSVMAVRRLLEIKEEAAANDGGDVVYPNGATSFRIAGISLINTEVKLVGINELDAVFL